MNFLNRRMFANGGPSAIGDYQIRDKITGKILIDLSQQPNFINTPSFNPYKILNDDTLEKGPAVLSILQRFQQRDAPQIGPFQAQEDLGTNIVDLGFGVARATEPLVRGTSRLLGETFGIQPLKEFGGKQEFNPSIEGPIPRVDLFKPTYESYVPTDQDRSRGMIALLKATGKLKEQDLPKQLASSPALSSAGDTFFDVLRSGDEKISNYLGTDRIFSDAPQDEIKDFQSEIDGFVGPTRPDTKVMTESETLGQLSPEEAIQKRIDFQKDMLGKNEFGDLLPEGRLEQDDEISTLLDEIKPIEQKVDVDKTEADTLAENEAKFAGLSQDDFRNEMDDLAMPELSGIERPTTDINIEKQEELRKQNDPVSRKLDQPGFFGSDRFLNFIRNVGGELARTGQMGAGLSLGAAKAAEERAARELMADQEAKKFSDAVRLERVKANLEELENEGFTPTESAKIADEEKEIAINIQQFEKSRNTLSNLNKVIGILDEGGATGIEGFFGEATDMIEAAIVARTGKSFEELNPRTRANSLLKVLRQANVREILGESGKTISNLDRQIVEDVFGDIKIGTPVSVSLKKLEDSRKNIINGMMATQNSLIANKGFFDRIGYSSPSLNINQSILDLIGSFTFENAESYIDNQPVSTGYIETTL